MWNTLRIQLVRVHHQGQRSVVDGFHQHLGAELAGFGVDALFPAQGHELFIQGDGHLGPGGGQKVRAAALAAVAVQGELGYHQDFTVDGFQAPVHLAVLVLEDPQSRQFVRQLHGLGLGVVMGDAQQDQEAGADAADGFAVHGYGGAFHAGQHCSHGNIVSFSVNILCFFSARRAGDPHDAGNLLDAAHDGFQLLAAGHVGVQGDQGEAVGGGAGVHGGHMGLGGGEHRGDIHDEVDAVLGHHLEGGAEGALHVLGPGHLDPAALLVGTAAGRVGVGTVLPVDRDTVALCDKADDLIAGTWGTAAGELHQAVAEALHNDALFAVGALGHGGAGGIGAAFQRHLRLALLLVLVENALDILPDAADDLQAADAPVADGGVQVVQALIGELFQDAGEVFVVGKLLQRHAAALQLRLEGGPARDHVFVPALPLEPLAGL